MGIEKLKEALDKDTQITDFDKEVLIKRAELSQDISKVIEEHGLEPIEGLRVLMGMACGMTASCKEPFAAVAFVLRSMAEYYDYYQTTLKEVKDANKDW